MTNNQNIELVRLMARFKLQVRRQLNEAVDLYQLERDSDYARQRLSEIEEQANDEELLVTLLHLRELLIPQPAVLTSKHGKDNDRYLFGARS